MKWFQRVPDASRAVLEMQIVSSNNEIFKTSLIFSVSSS